MPAGQKFLYLVTRGRKSGQPREIEIWYVAFGGRHYIVAEHREDAAWVKNLRACSEVSFSVGSRSQRESEVPRTAAMARPLDDVADADLARRVRHLMTAKYGWSEGLVVEIAPSD